MVPTCGVDVYVGFAIVVAVVFGHDDFDETSCDIAADIDKNNVGVAIVTNARFIANLQGDADAHAAASDAAVVDVVDVFCYSHCCSSSV